MKIILASASERRRYLIQKIFSEYEVIVPDVEEIFDESIDPVYLAVLNAQLKAKNVAEKIKEKDCLIISADTLVVVKNRILGKPDSYDTAFEYLKTLSNSTHKVITGCCLFHPSDNKILSDYDITFVTFRELTDQMIKNFLDQHSFCDKAGGYAVQEIGDEFVAEIKGSYDNVVGLPVEKIKKMLLDFEKLQSIEIVDIGFPTSFGIGKFNGKTVFVENAVPGDIVWFLEKRSLHNFSYAENCGVKRLSTYRVQPMCPHFGYCGGCTLQNLDYDQQLNFKHKYLIETLKRIGRIKNLDAVEPIIPSPETFYYRNKMEYAFGVNGRKIVLGLRERQSPFRKYRAHVNKIDYCPIFSEIVNKIFPFFIEFVEKNNIEPYNPFTKKGYVRHLVIRQSKTTNQVMLLLVTRSGIEINIADLVNSIAQHFPEISSFFHVENDQISDVVNYQKSQLIYGRPFIEETIKNFNFRIYPETFFQPNTKAAEKLYNTIFSLTSEINHERILGLYCGSGPMEIILSPIARQVIGVDNNDKNIETAIENCKVNSITNCEFYCLSAEEFLKKNTKEKIYDMIIVDPPRGGLSKKAIFNLLKVKGRFILYVSCNPATLARDLSIIIENGYTLKKAVPIDMFPHTSHLEVCCLLEQT